MLNIAQKQLKHLVIASQAFDKNCC